MEKCLHSITFGEKRKAQLFLCQIPQLNSHTYFYGKAWNFY